jgi:hypothetical protein
VRKASIAAAALAVSMMPMGGAHASGGGSGGEAGGESGLNLLPMDEVTVPIIDADRTAGALRFKLVLEAGNAETAARLPAELPVLRAATVAAGLEFARLNASAFRPVDAEQLDHDLTAALKAAEPGLSRVLIVEVEASRT